MSSSPNITAVTATPSTTVGDVNDQPERRRHRRDVGTDVERVGHHGERERGEQHWAREAFPDQGREAATGGEPEPRGSLLHRDGERRDRDRRPEQVVPERGTDLRVGTDPRRVVVGRTRHQPRTESAEVPVTTQAMTARAA